MSVEEQGTTMREQNVAPVPPTPAQPYLASETVYGEAGHTGGQTREGAAQDTNADQTSARRMLYRHPTDSVLGGVCGGLADYFGWDAALVRILWVVLTLATSGGGLIAYLALWILLPVGTITAGEERPARLELNERNLGRAAWLLISLGAIWLLGNVGILSWMWDGFWQVISIVFWPLLLIGVGYVLLRYIGKTSNWRSSFDGATGSVKSSMRQRMPDRTSVKSAFQKARERFPLKRSRNDRVWMGVCGGLGQRLGLDSNLVRLIWAAFSVGSIGMGVLIYVLAGLFLVEDTTGQLAQSKRRQADETVHDVQIIDAGSSRSA